MKNYLMYQIFYIMYIFMPTLSFIITFQTVNKSFKSCTPQSVTSSRGGITPNTFSSSQQKSVSVTPSSNRQSQPLNPNSNNRHIMNSSISPALSSQSTGDRLPRSKMIRPPKKVRLCLLCYAPP